MSERIQTGGALFDPSRVGLYFTATAESWMDAIVAIHDNVLTPIVYLDDQGIANVKRWAGEGKLFLIDSGVFTLAAAYAREHGVSLPEALGTPPDKVPDFEEHFARYVEVVRELEDYCWGYVEIDLGGRENKIKIRQRLEDLGLCPMPVYHPLNDGWEYFDYLAQRYDRVCVGNIVDATTSVRLRLLATIIERRRRYPELWIHLLGMSPHYMLYAWPCESLDSSSQLGGMRWGRTTTYAGGGAIGALPEGFNYRQGQDPHLRCWKVAQAGQQETRLMEAGWRHFLSRVVDILELRQSEAQGDAAWSFLAHWLQT